MTAIDDIDNRFPPPIGKYNWPNDPDFLEKINLVPIWHQNMLINSPPSPDYVGDEDNQSSNVNRIKISVKALLDKKLDFGLMHEHIWTWSKFHRDHPRETMSINDICIMIYPFWSFEELMEQLSEQLAYYASSDKFPAHSEAEHKSEIDTNEILIYLFDFRKMVAGGDYGYLASLASEVWHRYYQIYKSKHNYNLIDAFNLEVNVGNQPHDSNIELPAAKRARHFKAIAHALSTFPSKPTEVKLHKKCLELYPDRRFISAKKGTFKTIYKDYRDFLKGEYKR